ncbi:MAG TPA: VIT1/CCC1 transporter family protein [Anaerolineaceae bacterium]
MAEPNREQFIKILRRAWLAEQTGQRLYQALADHEKNPARRGVLLKLAETETQHGVRWEKRLAELGAEPPVYHDTLRERLWRWVLVQSGTENALARIESSEEEDGDRYAQLEALAPSAEDRAAVASVHSDEQMHARVIDKVTETTSAPIPAQARLDTILHRESWHKRGGGWLGQAIYGANDGLGSVFGIVSGVAGATAGGPAVLLAGVAGMLASALSMGSGAYLASKTEREVRQSEINRERKELELHPQEEMEELSLFYQLKGVPEEEAHSLAAHLVAQPEEALKTLSSEELGMTEQEMPNPWVEAVSASISTAVGAFIPIIPFFFMKGYPAIYTSFAISTLSHFLIGSAKTVVTGLSPWKSGIEMTAVGLGEAIITYLIGLAIGPAVG